MGRHPVYIEGHLGLHMPTIWKRTCDHDIQFLKWLINLYFHCCFFFFLKSHYLYTDNARKIRDKYKVVLDTPEYRKVQELKTHLSEVRMLNLSLQGPHSSSDPFSGNHTRQKISPLPFVKVATMSKQVSWPHFASVYLFYPFWIRWG